MRGSQLAPLIAAVVVLLIAIAGLVGWAAGRYTKNTVTVGTTPPVSSSQAVDPTVAEGAHYFVQFACAQCHGEGGQGGVSQYVPALTSVGKSLTVAQLTNIIEHGLGESANPKQPYMPVWKGVISPRQTSSLVAYVHAGLPA